MIGFVYIVVGFDTVDPSVFIPLSAHSTEDGASEAKDHAEENNDLVDYACVYAVEVDPKRGKEKEKERENSEQIRKRGYSWCQNRFQTIFAKIRSRKR